MRRLNIALIGYGFMGRAHSNAWRQVGSFFDVPCEPVLKVISGRTESELIKAANNFGWQEHSNSWEEVVSREDIDVVDICTPGNTHMPIALAAAASKKIIFCEKPLANTVAEAKQMLEAARANGCVHMLCHNYRRVPAVVMAPEPINAARICAIYIFRRTLPVELVVDSRLSAAWLAVHDQE